MSLNKPETRPIQVGDRVIAREGRHLRSCASAYQYAIVFSIDPFIMVSPLGDMLWQSQKIEDFIPIGKADFDERSAVAARMIREARTKVEISHDE